MKLRIKLSQAHGMRHLDPIQVLVEPITRARAKKFKEALYELIQANWAQSNLWRPIKEITHDIQTIKCVI